LDLLELGGLPGREREQLVSGLQRLQGTHGRLTTIDQIHEHTFIGGHVVLGLRLQGDRGAQGFQRIDLAYPGILGEIQIADIVPVLGRILVLELADRLLNLNVRLTRILYGNFAR